MIFYAFGVDEKYYKRVLLWGIIGAVIMRFIFIFTGAALVRQFDWLLLIFGAFLVFTGIKLYLDRNKTGKNVFAEPVDLDGQVCKQILQGTQTI